MARFGYYADLRGTAFSEGEKPKSWIMAMRVGDYKHPAYGQISFTADRIKRFADSVKNRVRGIALDIDYDHKADPTKGNEAAGWVEDARIEGDALMLLVEWTKSAAEKIKEGAYRYFSPEFHDEWTDATGVQHRDVLFGGGITNRPFLKDLLPVNLSELTFAEKTNEGKGMDLAKLRKLYGLAEDGSQDDQILTRAEEDRQAATNKGGTPPDRTGTTHAPNNGAGDPQQKLDGKTYDATTAGAVNPDGTARTPDQIELSELAKTNPAIAILLAEQASNNKRLAELEQANKLSEIKVKLNEYRTGSVVVAPAILEEASKLLIALPLQLHEKVHAMLAEVQKLGERGAVQLGEVGYSSAQQNPGTLKLAEDAVETAAKKLLAEQIAAGNKSYTMSDAYVDAMAADSKLFTEYQSAAYAFKI
jgi:hypothetical protein